MASPVNEEKEILPSMASPVNEDKETLPSSMASPVKEEEETLPSMAQGKETASESKEVEELSDEAWAEAFLAEDPDDAWAEAFLAEECFSEIDSVDPAAVQLGHGGLIRVLFETPSGFAIFTYDGIKLLRPRAIEDIWSHFAHEGMAKKTVWLREFKTFEDKASAISCTGVDEKLAMMIQNHVLPGQKLAVGNPEYRTIIEKEMKIHCLYDGAVMELMWGLRYQMRCVVPQEKLTNEEWFPMCEGIKIVLNRYDFDVKPEMMVNKCIIERVSVVYETDRFQEEQSATLHSVSGYLKDISEMNYEDWPLLKLVTALNLVCHPGKRGKYEKKMLRKAEYLRLLRDAREYEDKICGVKMSILYKYMWKARKDRDRALRRLFTLVGPPNFMKLNEGANNDQMIHEESNGAE